MQGRFPKLGQWRSQNADLLHPTRARPHAEVRMIYREIVGSLSKEPSLNLLYDL